MSSGINKAILIGTLGRDPETKITSNGKSICNFSIATNETWKDKSGVKQESTEWHNISAFDRLGEICGQYLKKGSQVYIEGKIQTRKYQAQDGSDRYSTSIVAREMRMLGGKGEQSSAPAPAPTPVSSGHQPGSEFDEDIPF
jgi:single-strand DNA-binding protein